MIPIDATPAERAEAAERIRRDADGLAELILAGGEVDVRRWLGLRGLLRLAEALSLFEPTERHQAAAARHPEPPALDGWTRYMASCSG